MPDLDLTDAALARLAIPARNALLTAWEDDQAEAEAAAEWEMERRAELWLENGGAHAEVIAWEHQEDERRAQAWV